MKRTARILSAVSAALLLGSMSSCGTVVERAGSLDSVPAMAPGTTSHTGASAGTSSVSSGTEPTTETTTEKVPDVMRGKLFDAKGNMLMYSEKGADGKEVRMTNDTNKVAFANVLNEMSEGLDLTYDDILRTANPTPVDGSDKVGQSVRLTFDADTQNAVYSFMASNNIAGSAVVM